MNCLYTVLLHRLPKSQQQQQQHNTPPSAPSSKIYWASTLMPPSPSGSHLHMPFVNAHQITLRNHSQPHASRSHGFFSSSNSIVSDPAECGGYNCFWSLKKLWCSTCYYYTPKIPNRWHQPLKFPPRTSKQDGLHSLAAVWPLQNPTSSKKRRGNGRKGREREREMGSLCSTLPRRRRRNNFQKEQVATWKRLTHSCMNVHSESNPDYGEFSPTVGTYSGDHYFLGFVTCRACRFFLALREDFSCVSGPSPSILAS